MSQGYALSNQNNYLTMQTSGGTAQFTDGGMNVTWRISDKLRVGAQAYDRYIGELGKGRVSLDWAVLDYRFRDWLGFRAGKVKTPLGLFTDAQDQEFLYTWALLPQAVYPLDLRELAHAHVGGDLYGSFDTGKKGFLSYQMYAGKLPSDYRSGYIYSIEDSGFKNVRYSARTAGYDLRWTTPVTGLFTGFSQSFRQSDFDGELAAAPIRGTAKTYMGRQTAVYGEFSRGKWRLDAEYRHQKLLTRIWGLPQRYDQSGQISPGWFAAVSYRVSRLVELGTYRSQFRYTPLFRPPLVLAGPGANHLEDTVVALRLDPKSYWNVKVEGHFMNGFGNALAAHGFYSRFHPQGIKPTTNLLVLRTGLTF